MAPQRDHELNTKDASATASSADVSLLRNLDDKLADLEANTVHAPTSCDAPPRAPAPPPAASKIFFLDGLRGLAALLVVFHHVMYFPGVNLGAPAVDMFFVLSAFLLTMIFEKKARQLFQRQATLRSWAIALVDYFVRRFLRVYPLFAVIACVIALLRKQDQKWLFGAENYYGHYNLFKTLMFVPAYRYHVFWTLPIEIGYYFFIPPLLIAIVKASKFWWLLAAAGYTWVFYSGFCVNREPRVMGPHIPTFLCGSLAAVVYGRVDSAIKQHKFEFRTWHRLVVRAIEISTLVMLLSTCFNGLVFEWIMANPNPRPGGGTIPFVSFGVTVIIVGEMLLPGPIASVLEWSLLRYSGKVSYSMYLLHMWISRSHFIQHQKSYNRFFALWTLIFLVSTISFQLIEAPCQRLAARVGRALKKRDKC